MENINFNVNINLTYLIVIIIFKRCIHKKSRNIINGEIKFRDSSFARGLLET
jgi:hypothetical protein